MRYLKVAGSFWSSVQTKITWPLSLTSWTWKKLKKKLVKLNVMYEKFEFWKKLVKLKYLTGISLNIISHSGNTKNFRHGYKITSIFNRPGSGIIIIIVFWIYSLSQQQSWITILFQTNPAKNWGQIIYLLKKSLQNRTSPLLCTNFADFWWCHQVKIVLS